nr:Rieske 2Fe-2S domain-containing protein [Acanthopleuribacter pedis]
MVLGAVLFPSITAETLLIRGFGTASFVLLHVILYIGPAARLFPRLLPLLYNRRHMGVSMFVLGLAHGVLALIQYHVGGDQFPLVSLLTSNGDYASVVNFPFQLLGFLALGILFLMAATSHDFWLANLTAPVWKALHMLVYVAYALLVAHVALGYLQNHAAPVTTALLGLGVLGLFGLHAAAALREGATDKEAEADNGWVYVARVDEILENRARMICAAGERIAVFKYEGKVSAVSNVCQHQNGPLGEGKIVDGCITCPWHGYQYRPKDGASPPPFTEKIPTFRAKVTEGKIYVDPKPLPPGTEVEPALIQGEGVA